MENPEMFDAVIGGLAIVVVLGGFLMMFTTVFTNKK